MTLDHKLGMKIAYEEARKSYNEGGIPIGGCLIKKDGTIISRGHNMRVQKQSATLHGEICVLERAGRLPASVYKDCILYTTLSACPMCSGSVLLYKIPTLVCGEDTNFKGPHDWLEQNGVEVINLNDQDCKELMAKFIKEKPELWYEDIGED
ncbi:FCY1 [Candida pseudojiufengensis]|uniref:FCY1 n=1 Tax=Candida pseudojiufengensis TaxID=497109 RepID=UPI002225A263|nr:FCY1 [Candida pseudojiufengensis]KAI5963017.1 FCY1 [Candida pseudojiufengensis]